jgi:hypothetical protein
MAASKPPQSILAHHCFKRTDLRERLSQTNQARGTSYAEVAEIALRYHEESQNDEILLPLLERSSGDESGLTLDGTVNRDAVRPTKLPRPDQMAHVRDIAAGLVAYANAAPTSEGTLTETQRVMSLNGEQLKVLIRELRAASGLPDPQRREFLDFAIRQLTKTHPKDALAILIEIPDLDRPNPSYNPPDSLFANAMRGWASIDPEAARSWMRENRDRIPEKLVSHVETALVGGAARSTPRLALQLHSESGLKHDWYLSPLIRDNCTSPEERLAFLDAFREWRDTLPEGELNKDTLTSCFSALAYPKINRRPADFPTTSDWLARADFSATELERVTATSFDQQIIPTDAGQWIEWLEKTWPKRFAERCQLHLLRGYQTSVPAAEWLMTQPDSPRRREMVGYCALTAYDQHPQTAIQLILSLPEGPQRQSLLAGIYAKWPMDEPDSRAAAEAFAKEHGIND